MQTQEPFSQPKSMEQVLTDNLLKDSRDSIYFKDLESRFLRVSEYFVRRMGLDTMDQLIGKTDFDFFDYEHATDARNDELEIIKTGEALAGKVEKEVLPNGETRWVFTSKMPLLDENGAIVGTFGISRDITAQREAEQALEQSNKKLIDASRRAGMAEIAVNILHNIGNVLNSVNVSTSSALGLTESFKFSRLNKTSELLEANVSTPNFLTEDARGKNLLPYLRKLGDQMSQCKGSILDELKALDRHVNHIKEVLKTQQGHAKSVEVLEPISISEIIKEAVEINHDALVSNAVVIETDIVDDTTIRTDKHRVLQILVNLIKNAKDACDEAPKPKKRVSVVAKSISANEVEISVTDNGIGISEKNLETIFKHGFTTRADGNGYGLHSCANLAVELGGTITAHSDGPLSGATMTLTLPLLRKGVSKKG